MFDRNRVWYFLKKKQLVTIVALFVIIFSTIANAQAINLPETGQTACYAP